MCYIPKKNQRNHRDKLHYKAKWKICHPFHKNIHPHGMYIKNIKFITILKITGNSLLNLFYEVF